MSVYGVDYPEAPDFDPTLPAITLDELAAKFRRWLGEDYDIQALDAVLSAAAVERLDGTRYGCSWSPGRETPRPRPWAHWPGPGLTSPQR